MTVDWIGQTHLHKLDFQRHIPNIHNLTLNTSALCVYTCSVYR